MQTTLLCISGTVRLNKEEAEIPKNKSQWAVKKKRGRKKLNTRHCKYENKGFIFMRTLAK